ncbi:hypothetical protein [Desulfosarcina ovata]|nr:hypothetical protein [Desulfosarcina ovata]
MALIVSMVVIFLLQMADIQNDGEENGKDRNTDGVHQLPGGFLLPTGMPGVRVQTHLSVVPLGPHGAGDAGRNTG